MNLRPFLLSAVIAVFALSICAQNNLDTGLSSMRPNPVGGEEFSRPRIVNETTVSSAVGLEQQAFQLLNSERATIGLQPLVWNEDVANVARLHSGNMAKQKFFSHKGADGKMVDDRADSLGLGAWRAIGENIAYLRGFQDPVKIAVEKWMQSTSHRQNLLNSQWSESAVGVAMTDDGTYYFTQVFLLRK